MSYSMSDGGGVDASIPLAAGKGVAAPPNALQTIGQFAEIKNALNWNALFPAQQQQLDIANQRSQLGLQSDQSSLIQQQRQLGYASLAPMLAKKGPLSLDDMTTALAGAEKSGVVTQPVLAEMQHLPITGDPATDDATFRAHILANTQAPAAAAAAVTPGISTIDTGPAIQPVTIGARGMPDQGQVQPAGGAYVKGVGPQYVQTGAGNVPTNNGQPTGPAIPNAPSPADRNQLQQVWNPATKQFDYVPRQSVAPMVDGSGQPVNGGAASVPGLPTTGRPTATPATPGVPPAGAAASAPLGTQQEAEAAAMHAGEARGRANVYQQTIQPVEAAYDNLQGADTGRAGETLNSIRANIQDIAPNMVQRLLPATVTDPATRAAYEEASKYLTAMAVNSPGGARSNEGQAAAMNANASTHISNLAAQQVVRAALAQRRLEQVGTLAFNNATGTDGQPLPSSQYDRFMNQWNTSQDPRAFIVDKMTPAERAQLVTSMGGIKSAAYQKFRSSYQQGVQTGVIANPSGASQ